MSSGKAIDPGEWKNRYARLAEEFEEYKINAVNVEKMLLRLIARLATAAAGLDAELDPHLDKIRDLAKTKVRTEAMRKNLDALSENLFNLVIVNRSKEGPQNTKHEDPFGRLFDFFKFCASSDHDINNLISIQRRVERNDFADEEALFEALKAYLQSSPGRGSAGHEKKVEKPGIIARLFGKGGGAGKDDNRVEMAPLVGGLLEFLDSVATPLEFQREANLLRNRLNAQPDGATFVALFQDTVAFLAKCEAGFQREQVFFEGFLSDLSSRLSVLEQQAMGVHDLAMASEASSANLRTTFADHMENLQTTARAVTDIEQLKLLVSNRLQVITDYLSAEREAEVKRVEETETLVEQLTNRLRQLEMEADELRTKLNIEHNMAMRDHLTGLPNRQAYEERIAQELARRRRFKQDLSMLLWDIDHFKSINDRFGHQAGDMALVTIAQTLATSIRETDFVARLGGEEFVMVLPGANKKSAFRVAEGIRGKVEECGFNSRGMPVKITISCGIGEFAENDTPVHVLERADQALYQAKNEGRNRCVLENCAVPISP